VKRPIVFGGAETGASSGSSGTVAV